MDKLTNETCNAHKYVFTIQENFQVNGLYTLLTFLWKLKNRNKVNYINRSFSKLDLVERKIGIDIEEFGNAS